MPETKERPLVVTGWRVYKTWVEGPKEKQKTRDKAISNKFTVEEAAKIFADIARRSHIPDPEERLVEFVVRKEFGYEGRRR